MRVKALVSILTLLVLLTSSSSDAKQRKHKKVNGRHKLKPVAEVAEDMEIINMLERDEKELMRLNMEESAMADPCYDNHCGAGKICKVTENLETQCICIPSCTDEPDPRRKVCSNHNETWNSDCALHQMRCWCQQSDSRCINPNFSHMHIEYFGTCKETEDCSPNQMADFPRRMRDWLFNIMRDMAEREELSPYYTKMEMEAETNFTKRWANAAVWKWCDLEKSHDRAVSRHELFPIRGHLMALEHCIAPFLDGCDANNDHKITLQEWAKCLEIGEDVIEGECEDVREEE